MFKKVSQKGRGRRKTAGIPSRIHWGFFGSENAAGDLFQHPVTLGVACAWDSRI